LARPAGSRNIGFEERKSAIARAVLERMCRPGGARASLRELASAAGVGLPTVRHYFGDRAGLVAAAFAESRKEGLHWLALARTARTEEPMSASLRWFLGVFAAGWDHGLGLMFSQTLAAAVDDEVVGPAFVGDLLEPTLQAAEARLAVHRDRGELGSGVDLRHAALALFCPVLMGLLHQGSLRGARCRPLDLEAFLDDHVERFVRAFGPPPERIA
jgi:AcrR family transcriptional regulator